MSVFSAVLNAISISAAQDIWEIVSPSASYVSLREIVISQYSDFGDTEAELISILLVSGYTTSGSGGASVTPANLRRWSTAPAATATVERNNTTVAQNGTGVVLRADSFNIASGWWYRPPEDERIILPPSTRLVARITQPTDAITVNSTLIFEESPSL